MTKRFPIFSFFSVSFLTVHDHSEKPILVLHNIFVHMNRNIQLHITGKTVESFVTEIYVPSRNNFICFRTLRMVFQIHQFHQLIVFSQFKWLK